MGKLDNKVAIVTGGGSGIGAATAKLLVEQGAKVLIVGRTESKLQATVENINNPNVSYFVADVSKASESAAYVAEAVKRYGGLDICVANAGTLTALAPVHLIEEEDFDQAMNVNAKGSWLSIKYSLPEMHKRGGGAIVLISSIAASAGFGSHTTYTASKHAVLGILSTAFIDALAMNVRINAVSPGTIENDMMEIMENTANPENPQAVKDMLKQRIPMKRYGKNEEIAQTVLFLVSDDSSYVTGANIVVDGGWTNSLM